METSREKTIEIIMKKIEEQHTIDCILAIYNGYYKSYNDYLQEMKTITELIRERNAKITNSKNSNKLKYYIEPIILSEDIYYYIKLKKKEIEKHDK